MSDDFTDAEELQWFRELDDISKTFDRIFAKIKADRRKTEDAAELNQKRLRKVGTDGSRTTHHPSDPE